MFGQKNSKSKIDFVLITMIFLVGVSLIVSYRRYFTSLDYDIYLQVECDTTVEVCTTDEETYYSKFVVKARVLQDNCRNQQDDVCVLDLYSKGLATKLDCEENLADWESCVDIEESPVSSSLELQPIDNE